MNLTMDRVLSPPLPPVFHNCGLEKDLRCTKLVPLLRSASNRLELLRNGRARRVTRKDRSPLNEAELAEIQGAAQTQMEMVEMDECPSGRIREMRLGGRRETSKARNLAVRGRIKGWNGGHRNRRGGQSSRVMGPLALGRWFWLGDLCRTRAFGERERPSGREWRRSRELATS
jgi:hypothetical protein